MAGSELVVVGFMASSELVVLGFMAGSKLVVVGFMAGNELVVVGFMAGSELAVVGFMAGSELVVVGFMAGSELVVVGFMAGSKLMMVRFMAGSELVVVGFMAGSELVVAGFMIEGALSHLPSAPLFPHSPPFSPPFPPPLLQLSLFKSEPRNCSRALKRLGHIDLDGVVQLKGRVACVVTAGDEPLVTELMLEGAFNSIDPHQLVAVASCFLPSEKSNEEQFGGHSMGSLEGTALLLAASFIPKACVRKSNEEQVRVCEACSGHMMQGGTAKVSEAAGDGAEAGGGIKLHGSPPARGCC
ncbi:unnamed protein product [Closterium sp. NIES-65]|nr:unnamed protein product [Closterium sp. NIES-65]